MTIALKIGDEGSQVKGFIYLDAVTMYRQSLTGRVTSFPVASGGNIADHFIPENPKFSIEGVISNVDLSGISDLVDIDGEKPLNATSKPETPVIEGQESTLQFLPTVVKQFFDKTDAKVESSEAARADIIPAVQQLLTSLMMGTYYSEAERRWKNKMTLTSLYEMDGTTFSRVIPNLVITNVSVKEDPESGDGLFLSLELERVRFAEIRTVAIKGGKKTDTVKKATPTVNKGKVTPETGTSADQNKNKPKLSGLDTIETFREGKNMQDSIN